MKSKNELRINEIRGNLIANIGKINQVANTKGRGRDDFSQSIIRKASDMIDLGKDMPTLAIQKIAQSVIKTFKEFRQFLTKYSDNIEALDPQLKNNPDLV